MARNLSVRRVAVVCAVALVVLACVGTGQSSETEERKDKFLKEVEEETSQLTFNKHAKAHAGTARFKQERKDRKQQSRRSSKKTSTSSSSKPRSSKQRREKSGQSKRKQKSTRETDKKPRQQRNKDAKKRRESSDTEKPSADSGSDGIKVTGFGKASSPLQYGVKYAIKPDGIVPSHSLSVFSASTSASVQDKKIKTPPMQESTASGSQSSATSSSSSSSSNFKPPSSSSSASSSVAFAKGSNPTIESKFPIQSSTVVSAGIDCKSVVSKLPWDKLKSAYKKLDARAAKILKSKGVGTSSPQQSKQPQKKTDTKKKPKQDRSRKQRKPKQDKKRDRKQDRSKRDRKKSSRQDRHKGRSHKKKRRGSVSKTKGKSKKRRRKGSRFIELHAAVEGSRDQDLLARSEPDWVAFQKAKKATANFRLCINEIAKRESQEATLAPNFAQLSQMQVQADQAAAVSAPVSKPFPKAASSFALKQTSLPKPSSSSSSSSSSQDTKKKPQQKKRSKNQDKKKPSRQASKSKSGRDRKPRQSGQSKRRQNKQKGSKRRKKKGGSKRRKKKKGGSGTFFVELDHQVVTAHSREEAQALLNHAAADEPGCQALCDQLFTDIAKDPRVREDEVEPKLASTALYGTLTAEQKTILGDVIFNDLREANLKANRDFGAAVMDFQPLQDGVVKVLMARFRKFINWMEANLAPAQPLGQDIPPGSDYYHRVMHPQGRHSRDSSGKLTTGPIDTNSQVKDRLAYYGHAGLPGSEQDYVNVMNTGNMREQLSLMYTTLSMGGLAGGGFWTLLGNLLKHYKSLPGQARDDFEQKLWAEARVNLRHLLDAEQYSASSPCRDADKRRRVPVSLWPAGWVLMKQSCWAWWGGGPKYKVTPWQGSNSDEVRPKLSAREIEHLYHMERNTLGSDAKDAHTKDLRRFGRHVPWASGGDQFMSNAKMPGKPYSFPEWCEKAGQRDWAAPSGSTDMYFQFANFLIGGEWDATHKVGLRALMASWIELARDHSQHEVLMAVEPYGIPYMTKHTADHTWRYVWRDFFKPPGIANANYRMLEGLQTDFERHLSAPRYIWTEDATRATRWVYPHEWVDNVDLRNRRSLQIWFLHSNAARPGGWPSVADPLTYDIGYQGLEIPERMFIDNKGSVPWANDRYQYGSFTLVRWSSIKDYKLMEVFFFNHNGGQHLFVREREGSVSEHLKGCGQDPNCVMKMPWREDDYDLAKIVQGGYKGWVEADKGDTSSLDAGATTISGHKVFCLQLDIAKKDWLCTGQAKSDSGREMVFKVAEAVRLKRHLRNGLTCTAHLENMKKAFPHGFKARNRHGLTLRLSDAHRDVAKTWVCANAPANEFGAAIKILARCGKPAVSSISDANTKKAEASKEDCLAHSLRTLTVPCYWSTSQNKPLDAASRRQDCDITPGWWREVAEHGSVCMYTHEQGYSAFYSEKELQSIVNNAFKLPHSMRTLPPYDGVLFSGTGKPAHFADPLLTRFQLSWFSWSRNIHVSFWFQDKNRYDWFIKGPKERKQAEDQAASRRHPATMYILLNAPHGRQVGRVARYSDSEQEVLTPPAIYEIVGRRTQHCPDPDPTRTTSLPGSALETAPPRGAMTYVYVRFVSTSEWYQREPAFGSKVPILEGDQLTY